MSQQPHLTGTERFFEPDQIIVSKTNLQGRITYANRVFLQISGFTEQEVLGKPHRIIRHPDMPRCVFKLLWHTIQNGQEIFAYVINRCKNGDHYWVFAHVTPSRDRTGKIIGYHSNRRVPQRAVLENSVVPLYKKLREAELKQHDRKQGMADSEAMIAALLQEGNKSYGEYILTLGQNQHKEAGELHQTGS